MRMIWNTQIESIEKCSVSRIGAIKKHSIKKKKKKNLKIGFDQKVHNKCKGVILI